MNRLFRPVLLTVALALVAAPAVASTWTIDTSHSVLDFKVRHLFSKAGGSFDEWQGTLQFDGQDPSTLQADVTIQVASINTDNEDRDNHLRSEDFFYVEEYPTITFVSKKAEERDGQWYLVGDFTMRGVTKEVAIPFEFHGAGKDPWGNMRAGFSGELTVDRKEYGIEWNKALDVGGVMLGDDVDIELEVEVVEQGDAR